MTGTYIQRKRIRVRIEAGKRLNEPEPHPTPGSFSLKTKNLMRHNSFQKSQEYDRPPPHHLAPQKRAVIWKFGEKLKGPYSI